MSNITNLFSNLNDLVKPKSVTDSASDYTINNAKPTSLSLKQGNKFYKKMKGHLNENNKIEGFQTNSLTKQTMDLLQKTNISQNNHDITQNLNSDYNSTLTQYEDLLSTINSETTDYVNRVNPNNPYLSKVIKLQSGELFYVTNKGIAKYITSPDVYNNMIGQNGFPTKDQTVSVPISWDNSYQSPGAIMPTKPSLMTGTPIQDGQSVGNEGTNVYVNTMLNNPQSSYIGCYNNMPPSTEVMIVPKMNSSNNVNGYISKASSIYKNDNSYAGPWNAFNQDKNTWWHTYTQSANNLYDTTSGKYTGTTQISFNNTSGTQITVKGEWLSLTAPSPFPLTRYEIQGRQDCCGTPNGRDPNTWYILGLNNGLWYQVDYQTGISFNFKLLSFNVSNPTPYSAYMIIVLVAGDNKSSSGNRSCVQISQWNLYTSSNYTSNPSQAMTNVGAMNYDQCQNYSLNTGSKYFALQGVDSNGIGNCMVSNDLAGSQIYGIALNYKQIMVWSSNSVGTTMVFNNGSISVLNSSGAAVYATPNNTTQPSTYIGCYGDKSTRAMTGWYDFTQKYTNATCQQAAASKGMQYFGLQNSTSGTNAQCFTSNNLSQTQQYGVASNCTKISDGSISGGGWSNAVYNTTTPTMGYFLILQDDGNMCIYLGSSPDDKQGLVWQSSTNGKQQQPNPNFAASKGKYGKNWVSNGSTFAQGDFIGSTNGQIYLIMQSDGNLVLYTTSISSKCANVGGKNTGAQDTNALYELKDIGISSNMSLLAYIDQDSQLHSYPNTNAQYTNTYKTMVGTDSTGNDISGAAYGNATVDQCKTSCNNNPDCAGFSFSNNTCYPKTSSMYPNDDIQMNSSSDLYLRNKTPLTPPIGVSNATNNIDTVMYQNYINGGELSDSYGIANANATTAQKQQLQDLQTKLNSLSNQMNNLTNQYDTNTQDLQKQSLTNAQGLDNYIRDIKTTNKKIVAIDANVDNIMKESDIIVLQKNYDYLFWSIIAVTTVIISMNIIKK